MLKANVQIYISFVYDIMKQENNRKSVQTKFFCYYTFGICVLAYEFIDGV